MPAIFGNENIDRRRGERGGGNSNFNAVPVFTQILLADESNRATPKTPIRELLETDMQEEPRTAAGNAFRIIAAVSRTRHAKPDRAEEGTYPLA